MDSNPTQTQSLPSNPPKKHQNLKLVPLSITEHLDDFWEIWREERGVIWSTGVFEICFTEDGAESGGRGDRPKCVGFVGTNRPSPEGLEMGYCVNPDYYGNGYATWGVTEFLKVYWGMEERSHISHLVAKIDPRNKASERIIAKVGARKGEVLENFYSRIIDEGKLSDIRCWYLDRPGVGRSGEGKGEEGR
ncbi:putative gnat family protein [Botrytis fragariae]|uniref:Putative gnat family protein n=1 Tax=Botrytis fragariae TaxID=1964551 RepID=A0A8H6AT56_9HELO|nr:putative gnat family protein [Botrytis fragariae]KAF5873118.1 putative gnat family protein [Botrytis fragariae]